MEITTKVKIYEGLSQFQNEIIEKYWKYKDNDFVYKVGELASENELSTHDIVQLVKSNSSCHLTVGACVDCGQTLVFSITSRVQFKSKLNHIRCDIHHQKYNLEVSKELHDRGITYEELRLEKSLTFQFERLSKDHLEILAKIVQIDDRNKIFSKVIFGDENRTDKEVWKIVNDLESKGFLIVRRDQGKVVSFDFLDQLRSMLTDYFDDREIKQSIDNSVRTDLRPNLNKTKSTQPDLIGKIKLPEDFSFRKEIEYECGAWIKEDGSIYLKITPEGDFLRIGGQPKHIGDIISNQFDLNSDEN